VTSSDGSGFLSLAIRHGKIELVRAEPIEGRPGIVVRPEAVGVCRSDLKEIANERRTRSDFGHEVVGRVVRSDVAQRPVGSRVTFDPHVAVRRTTAFAELLYAIGPDALLREAFPLVPEMLHPHVAVFAEPLGCALRHVEHVMTVAGPRSETAAVVGAGTAGVLIGSLLTAAGIDVTYVNRSAPRVAALVRAGVAPGERVLTYADPSPRGYALVVVATAFADADAVRWALDHVADGGVVALYGAAPPGQPIVEGIDVDAVRVGHGITSSPRAAGVFVTGSHGAARGDVEAAVGLLAGASGERLRTTCLALVGEVWSLREAADRLAAWQGMAKVVVEPVDRGVA
jgi:threonine dehydrogenase-like Zn-dependent dehydrogenase